MEVRLEGWLMDTASGGKLGFQPVDVSTINKMFGIGSRKIRSYGCIHCRNLQLTVEFNEEDAQKYQEFEGQQPGVLERINSGEEQEASQNRLPGTGMHLSPNATEVLRNESRL